MILWDRKLTNDYYVSSTSAKLISGVIIVNVRIYSALFILKIISNIYIIEENVTLALKI